MQRLNTLFQIVSAASTVRDIAQTARTYSFAVSDPITFYLRAEYASVEIRRWKRPLVEVKVDLKAPFGWRVATDQDDAGVYIAAARRSVVGGLSRATFNVRLPMRTHLMLNLSHGTVHLRNINGMLEIPVSDDGA
jgi:hypothetical protein